MLNTFQKAPLFKFAASSLLSIALLITPWANAGSLICSGKISLLAIHQPGTIILQLSSMNTHIQICDLNADWVAPGALVASNTAASCKAMYATMLAGKYADKNFQVYFDGDQVPNSCSNFISWSNANLRYLNQLD